MLIIMLIVHCTKIGQRSGATLFINFELVTILLHHFGKPLCIHKFYY